ncbi:hypothetical protein BD769DRAFT_1658425 [Suillus cothurnatus]|nr:hypothetical protein BD769DRAFT_1658425 [Suillus cothurnatus]
MQQHNGYIGVLSAELQRYIMEEMSLPELMIFGSTRKENKDGITDYIAARRRRMFQHFAINVNDLNALLNRTGSVVSGSCALSLVQAEREAIIPKDMDIYTTEKFETEVLDHLKNKEGYECIKEKVKKTDYDNTAISRVHKLVREEQQVDVITTHWTCALAPILQFHSTAVMNYVTARSIICLYPRWTATNKSFIHPQMYLENRTHLHTLYGLRKYQRRGFLLSTNPFHLGDHICEGEQGFKKKGGYCPHALRSTIDEEVLAWDFGPMQTLGQTTIACQEMQIMAWCLGGHECKEGNKDKTISYMLVSA